MPPTKSDYMVFRSEDWDQVNDPNHVPIYEPITVVRAENATEAVQVVVGHVRRLGRFFACKGEFIEIDMPAAMNKRGMLETGSDANQASSKG